MTGKVAIKNREDKVLLEVEAGSMKEALEEAVGGGADLRRANLGGAYLAGADLGGRKIRRCLGTGWLLSYRWCAFEVESGAVLRYGCEQRDLADWSDALHGLCERHVSSAADQYEQALSALIGFVRTLAGGGGE